MYCFWILLYIQQKVWLVKFIKIIDESDDNLLEDERFNCVIPYCTNYTDPEGVITHSQKSLSIYLLEGY